MLCPVRQTYIFTLFKWLIGDSANLVKLNIKKKKKKSDDAHTAEALAVVPWCDKSWNRTERI